ncbi:hypothetical protein P170DRAFT_437152 [Aspergillus steynii IBT 23096]|uniref:Uncharacterized protein n=1 Tax=Aspergillus steynii IBT 23096 TaxID=1392250 RepID=A0A2I2G9M1_9EURO|nr:uncharacterized protein P170DRAFT_437152 [Aspergillus steynii IBT 23096]PLB49575.1 hypothetical protein P170DRAFT_437152 [Aspergillus steynii IBT 23096]
MNAPPSSPESDYQSSWEEEELRRALHNSLPKLAERLHEEIANNPELSARCIDTVGQESKTDTTQSSHVNGLEVIPEERNEQEMACPKAEGGAEPQPIIEMPTEASSQTAPAQHHNQENIPPMRRRVYSTSDTESPEPLLAPPSSPVANYPHHSQANGTK